VVDATLSGLPPAFAAAAADDSTARAKRPTVAAGPNEIAIDNFTFMPRELTVSTGTTVTWVNHDDVPHAIASASHQFRPSPVIDTGQRHALRLTASGTYDYFCSIHPTMTGRIVVR
jgi:plastocyanin